MAKTLDVGDTARVFVTFQDDTDTNADPSTVKFIVEDPSGNVTVSTYPTNITKTATGAYYSDVPVDEAGEWVVRFNGLTINNVAQACFEGVFQARSSRLAAPLP